MSIRFYHMPWLDPFWKWRKNFFSISLNVNMHVLSCCSCNYFPIFLKFWTLLLILSYLDLFGIVELCCSSATNLDLLRLNWGKLFATFGSWMIIFCPTDAFDCEVEIDGLFYLKWFSLSLSEVYLCLEGK